jgi:hypothetical protein
MRHAYWLAGLGLLALASCAPSTDSSGAGPMTSWGDPDLQGTWYVIESVPLERSAANEGREFLTDEEVAELDAEKSVDPGRNARSDNSAQDVSGAYNAVFNSVLRTSRRTSMIIDPPDGRIPPLVGQEDGGRGGRGGRGLGGGRGGRGGGRGFAGFLGTGGNQTDNPETTAQSPRCLGVQAEFLPLNTAFAQGTVFQLVQSPESVAIYLEDDHAGGGNRVIYMDDRPVPQGASSYLGYSRGHWDGDSLVVETTGFEDGFRGSNPETFRMIERFTRVGDQLNREITFDDPQTWTRPWTVLIEMGRAEDGKHMIFDSACHEGNYGMTGILMGARAEEMEAAGAQ